jgi:hypothetical protein
MSSVLLVIAPIQARAAAINTVAPISLQHALGLLAVPPRLAARGFGPCRPCLNHRESAVERRGLAIKMKHCVVIGAIRVRVKPAAFDISDVHEQNYGIIP